MKSNPLLRTATLLLALLLLLGTAACSTGNGDETTLQEENTLDVTEETTGSGEETVGDPDAAAFASPIAENGKFLFTLIRPDSVVSSLNTMFLDLRTALQELSGMTVVPKTDFHLRGTEPDTTTLEILIGNCDRYETDEVQASLGINDWAVRAVKNKIVVYGHNKKTLQAAIDYFLTEAIEKTEDAEGKTVITYLHDYTYSAGEEMLFTEEAPISSYTVVYGDEANRVSAEKLAKSLSSFTGATIAAVSDATAETPYEILFGKTNRNPSAYNKVSEMMYLVKAEGTKLMIGGSSELAMSVCATAFLEAYVPDRCYTDLINFAVGYSKESVAYASKEDKDLYGDADLRIMSWNLLCELWDDKVPVEIRDEKVAAAILHYAPDVVGLQEMTPAWYNALDSFLLSDYAFVTRKNQYGNDNYSTLYYNKKTVKVVTSGVVNYTKGNSKLLRLVTWALFERLSDGARFIVTSTHWDTSKTESNITAQAEEMADLVKRLHSTYSVPVFCTGDYNRNESTAQYDSFVKLSGFVDTRYTAKTVNREGATYHGTLGVAPSGSGAIDHIFVSNDAKVLFFNLLVDQTVLDASDHVPIYIDVKLTK